MGPSDDEEPRAWRNWAREQVCHPAEIVRPRTREGLAWAIIAATEAGRPIKVAGSGHSFSEAALTDGTMLQIEALDRLLDADPDSGLVKVEAGAVLGELNRTLDDLGLAFENLGDIDKQTLAGSISTGTHGTGIRFQNISAQIEAIEMILADGTSVELSESSDPKGFAAARIGLGALGAIYSVTLRTVPAYTVSRLDHPLPLAEVLDCLQERVDAVDHFEFYVFPHTETALCRESTRTDQPPQPPSPAGRYLREVVIENWLSGAFTAAARVAPPLGPRLARLAAGSFANVSKVDSSHRVFASERRLKFTEMEYGIPASTPARPSSGCWRSPPSPKCSVCSRSRFGSSRVMTHCSAPATSAIAATSPSTRTASSTGPSTSVRLRRSSPTTAAGPTGASVTSRPICSSASATRDGSSSRPLASGSTPRAASPTPTPIAFSARLVEPTPAATGPGSEEGVALAPVGRRLGDDFLAFDQVESVEALTELTRLGVAQVDAVADPQA